MLITDNGHQFTRTKFERFCKEYGIAHHLTSIAHPQANGEVKVMNRTILRGIKTKLEKTKRSWVDELYHLLWAYRTTPGVPTEETPFSLTFGMEAVILIKIEVPSARTENFDEQTNSQRPHANLDLLEEAREKMHVRMTTYQQKVIWYYMPRFKIRSSESVTWCCARRRYRNQESKAN